MTKKSLSSLIRKSLTPKLQDLVKSYPSINRYPMEWGRMDAFQHLNNVWHVRYFENGRFDYLEEVFKHHLTHEQYEGFRFGKGVGVIMKNVFVNYKATCTFPDQIIVASSVALIDNKKDRFRQFALLLSEKDERVIAECLGTVVMFNHTTQTKADLPKEYLEAISAAEKDFGVQHPPQARL